MFTFSQEQERRVAQFSHYLNLMQERQRLIKQGDSFIIFEDCQNGDDPDNRHLNEAKKVPRTLSFHLAGRNVGPDSATLDATIEIDLPEEGWRNDDSAPRFVQFRFNARYFDLDIPNTTLDPMEAKDILLNRSGFFFVKDCRQFEYPKERVDTFNPLRKVYLPGDERSAAEDMAYVWFTVWKYPVDWRFYVTANAFKVLVSWERGFPIE